MEASFTKLLFYYRAPGGGPLDPHRNSVQNAGVSGARTATPLVVGIPWYYHGLCTTMVYVLPWSMYYHGLCTKLVQTRPPGAKPPPKMTINEPS